MNTPRLTGFELAWTDAAFDTFFPEGSALPHGVKQMQPARFMDDMLVDVPLEQSLGLRVALWIIGLAPVFTIRKLTTFGSLDAGDRTQVLERLLASPIYGVRQLVAGFKAVATLLYSQSPAIRRAMHTPRIGVGVGEAVAPLDLVPVERLRSSGAYPKPGVAKISRARTNGGRRDNVA